MQTMRCLFLKLDRNKFRSGLSDICTARGLWVFSWLNPFLRFLVWAEQPLKLPAEAAQQEETFRTQNLGELNPFCQRNPHQTHPKCHFHHPSVLQHRISLPPAQESLPSCQGSLSMHLMPLSKLPQREEELLEFISKRFFNAGHK